MNVSAAASDLWWRTDLGVRDRSLMPIAALAAMGDDDQLDPYVRLGIESGRFLAAAVRVHPLRPAWPRAR